jgi:hypothetical protein
MEALRSIFHSSIFQSNKAGVIGCIPGLQSVSARSGMLKLSKENYLLSAFFAFFSARFSFKVLAAGFLVSFLASCDLDIAVGLCLNINENSRPVKR